MNAGGCSRRYLAACCVKHYSGFGGVTGRRQITAHLKQRKTVKVFDDAISSSSVWGDWQ